MNAPRLFLLGLLPALLACSAYESPGRKYLEQNAYGYAGVSAKQNILNCEVRGVEASWVPVSRDPRADVFRDDTTPYKLHVRAHEPGEAAGCDFQFGSEAELISKIDSAIALTSDKTFHF